MSKTWRMRGTRRKKMRGREKKKSEVLLSKNICAGIMESVESVENRVKFVRGKGSQAEIYEFASPFIQLPGH